ncbi:MAG: Ferrochelatase [Candidatus Anoxychlamydiales bacterium]|nr:Ferrochelatase [Candidatus Anoxychlamydiales bacterium]
MFPNKKIVYIFASLGDGVYKKDIASNKVSFFLKIFQRSKKKIKVQQNINDTFEISEKFISKVSKYSEKQCFSFYLHSDHLHEKFIKDVQTAKADRYYIFPLYPQYNLELSNLANFFSLNLYREICDKFFWVKSYSQHSFFTKALQKNIKNILKKNVLDEKETLFLFLAKDYINNSPLYILDTEITCQNIVKAFQYVEGSLLFFNEDTNDLKMKKRKNIIIIPITTLIDNYETIQTIGIVKKTLEEQKKQVFVCKTLNHSSYFIRSIFNIIDEKNFVSNEMLL